MSKTDSACPTWTIIVAWFVGVVVWSVSAPAFAQTDSPAANETATLRIQIRFQGAVPSYKPIETKDAFCQQFVISDDRLVVGENGNLANAVLIWDEKRNGHHLPRAFEKPKDATVEFKFKDCTLQPRIAVARVGQQVLIRNEDENGHSGAILFVNHEPLGSIAKPNAPFSRTLTVTEPAPMPVGCNVHPWERAYLIVKDHPLVGISNGPGGIEIKNLPVGKNWFQIWQESAKLPLTDVVWNGQELKLCRGRLLLELGPGVNDHGIIELKAEQFKLDNHSAQAK